MSDSELPIGRRVQLADQRHGFIRFRGKTRFQTGEWVGVELDDDSGKNDGSVNGVRYFECEMNHGMFVRPTALKVLEEPSHPFFSQSKKKGRPSSMLSASSRGSTPADPSLNKRISMNAPSPTPTPKLQSRTPSGIRSPTRSPTKQLGTAAPSSGVPSRTTTPSNAKPLPGARPRPSTMVARPSMAPPPIPARQTRQPSSAALPKTTGPPTRTPSGRLTVPAKPNIGRQSTTRSSSAALPASAKIQIDNRSDSSSAASAPRSSDEDPVSPALASPVQSRTMALEKLTGSTSTKPTAITKQQPTKPSNAAVGTPAAKEIEDLKAKLRVLEKKRIEDRERLNDLEKAKSERDRFERIIQTLQIKYQPQQQEIADLKRQLKEAETRLYTVEDIQQEHETAMELATLDREMAEEMADVYKTELEALKHKSEELKLEVDILREENTEFTKGMSSEDIASTGWLQMEKDNERLREALIRLRDISREQEDGFKHQIKEMQETLAEGDAFKDKLHACELELARKESAVEDLREQLDNALGAEDIIETLTEQTMNQSEEIKELKATVLDLEELKDVSDELEINHVNNQKEMQEEIDRRDAIIAEQARQAAVQQKVTEDNEYTLSRFRELVTSLQSDLADMHASRAVTENESEQLNTRSRAMLDLNMKLQISAAKAQVKTIDLELRHMEAREAEQHLEIVTMFLPDSYQSDRDSVLALLRFKRLASKADIISSFIKERVNGQTLPGHENELFEGCGAMDKLAWVSCMCDRFINSISHCSLEQFAKYEGALYELEPVERALNGWIEGLKQDDLKEDKCSAELQRTIALMTHLSEVHISSDLESFADDIHMKASLMQSYLESAAVSFTATSTMVQRVVAQDDEELGQHFSKKAESVVSQTRSAKVIANKTVRALEDLKARSLSLLPDTLDAFEQCETATAQLADMARKIGLDLHDFLHDEGRTDPYTYSDVQSCIQNTAMTAYSSDESDIFSTYLNKLRSVTSQISDLAALSVDLTNTQEFERSAAPWILRSQELKLLKTIPVEVEAETRRLKDELNNTRRNLAIREEDLSTSQLKIETLESRMRDAKAKASRISELELQIEAAKDHAATLSESIEKQDRELKSLELECDKWKQVASSSRVVTGGGAEEGEAGAKANQERAVATAREIDTLKKEVDGLRSTVRYLRDDNRRARTNDQPNHDWLAEPLIKNAPPVEQRKANVARESRAVLGELVNIVATRTIYDLTRLPTDRVAWKPAEETPQFQSHQQMQNFLEWKAWRSEMLKYGAGTGKSPVTRMGESALARSKETAGGIAVKAENSLMAARGSRELAEAKLWETAEQAEARHQAGLW